MSSQIKSVIIYSNVQFEKKNQIQILDTPKARTENQFSKILKEKNLGKLHIEHLVPSL